MKKISILAAIFLIALSFVAGLVSAEGTDHPVCTQLRIEVSVNGPSYTVPAPPAGWTIVSVWSKSGDNPHRQQSAVVGSTFTSGEFNQNGQEQDISHVDLCKEQKYDTTTTTTTEPEETTSSSTTTSTSTSTTLDSTTTTSTTSSTTSSVPDTSSSTSSSEPTSSTSSSEPSSTSTSTSTPPTEPSSTVPGSSSSTPSTSSEPTVTTAPPGPTEPTSPPVPRQALPETGAGSWLIVGLALALTVSGLMILGLFSWKRGEVEIKKTRDWGN